MRKTKLMALLLATLMVVAVFAGCASGVKQEAVDALDKRVDALESQIAGVGDKIDNIKIPEANNDEILDAINGVKEDLKSEIEKIEDRVDAIEKEPTTPGTTTTPDAAVKAAAQAAQAEIEVKKGVFAKNAAEYTEEDYAKILEAFGAASAAVNAATTVAEVDAAKAALATELDKYMTYAMKAYDYYTRLLGNITEDAEDLVDEAKAFLKDLKEVYDEKNVDFAGKLDGVTTTKTNEWIAEVAYLVSAGSTEARDEYINVYANIETLIALYNGTSKSLADKDLKKVYYENEKGKVDYYELGTLAAYTKAAEDLVDDIEDLIGDALVFSEDLMDENDPLTELFDAYDAFAEDAEKLGGQKLVDLVTNAADLIAAQDAYDNLMEAVEAYDEATVVSRKPHGVFYYYNKLVENGFEKSLEYQVNKVTDSKADDDEYAFVSDIYAEVDEILADWVDAYDLSEENMLAIIDYMEKKADFYTDTTAKSKSTSTYVYNKHYNALLTAACEKFESDIADKILDLNGLTNTSVDAVLDYNAVEEAIEDLLVLQEADKTAEYPKNLAIELSAFDADDWKVILRESGIYEDLTDNLATKRIEAYAGIIDLYTFEADIDALDDADMVYFDYVDHDDDPDTDEVIADNRANEDYCEIYTFFTTTYTAIENAADNINYAIEDLVEKVEDKKLPSNEAFITLEGKYVKLTGSETYESDGVEFNAADNCYVAIDKLKQGDAYDDYMDDLAADASIEAFLYHYGEFEDMLDLDDFNAAKKTINDRIDTLFADIDEIVALVEKIDYVRVDGAVVYEDANKNGKYDDGEELAVQPTITELVSLNDAAAVNAAIEVYNEWVYAGGSTDIAYFANLVDDDDVEYDDVFEMVNLENVDEIKDTLKTLEDLDAAIQALQKKADQFVAAVNNAIAVNKATPFKVTVDENYLNNDDGSSSTKWWTWTKRTLSTAEDARDNEGTYTFVVKDKPWELASGNSYTAKKGDPYTFLEEKTYNKADLLKKIAAMYEEFVLANVEYKADADNDYVDGDTFYYQAAEYVEYKAFEDAVKAYTDLDLLSAKGYVLATVGAGGTTDSFRAQIANAKDIAALENAIYNYNVNATTKITSGALNVYTIYDFDRLPSTLA